MHTVSRQGMSLLSSVPVLYAYMNMHTSYTLTHTCGHRRTSTHNYTYIKTFIPTHTSICPHPRIYPHTSIHAHIFARTTYTHLCASAKTNTCICIQNKKCIHRHYTQRTHTHTDTLIR